MSLENRVMQALHLGKGVTKNAFVVGWEHSTIMVDFIHPTAAVALSLPNNISSSQEAFAVPNLRLNEI